MGFSRAPYGCCLPTRLPDAAAKGRDMCAPLFAPLTTDPGYDIMGRRVRTPGSVERPFAKAMH